MQGEVKGQVTSIRPLCHAGQTLSPLKMTLTVPTRLLSSIESAIPAKSDQALRPANVPLRHRPEMTDWLSRHGGTVPGRRGARTP